LHLSSAHIHSLCKSADNHSFKNYSNALLTPSSPCPLAPLPPRPFAPSPPPKPSARAGVVFLPCCAAISWTLYDVGGATELRGVEPQCRGVEPQCRGVEPQCRGVEPHSCGARSHSAGARSHSAGAWKTVRTTTTCHPKTPDGWLCRPSSSDACFVSKTGPL
jgi:hypothetical protein